jgi:hypothetical protein
MSQFTTAKPSKQKLKKYFFSARSGFMTAALLAYPESLSGSARRLKYARVNTKSIASSPGPADPRCFKFLHSAGTARSQRRKNCCRKNPCVKNRIHTYEEQYGYSGS